MLPTISLPVQSDANYNEIISESEYVHRILMPISLFCKYPVIWTNLSASSGIRGFESRYELAGGINRPKKIICLGTDGLKRTLLVKVNFTF